MATDFPQNLRLLTSHYPSVAEVCRRLGFNRSQFNRYLAGRSRPSANALKRICDFFGVEHYEIERPHGEFRRTIGLDAGLARRAEAPAYLADLERLIGRSRGDLADYAGYYHEYSYSMTRPGLILRSLLCLAASDGVATYRRLENMARPDLGEARQGCKYRGLAFYLNDRLFLVDYDSLTGNEISQTVLYPNYQTRLTRLSGLKLGVAASPQREPLCARVLVEALGRGADVKAALAACGLFTPEDPAIAPEIKDAIANAIAPGERHFRVAP